MPRLVRLGNILRPYYVYRPRQLVARLWHARREAPRGPLRARVPWGELEVDPRDGIGHAVWQNGVHDLLVSEVLWRLGMPGATVVDVGANIGCMTSLLAARVGREGRVIAIEPHPGIRERLLRNVDLSRATGRAAPVEVVGAAVGDRTGTAFLVAGEEFEQNCGTARVVEPGADAASAAARPGRSHQVPLVTLDSLLADTAVQVLKLDVEGHEAAVIRGASRLLGGGFVRHVVYEELDGAAGDVHQQLEAHGFRIFALGWRLGGPLLGERSMRLARADEAPSFLATLAEGEARERLQGGGWRVLRAS